MNVLDIMRSDKEAKKTLWFHAALAGISITYFFALFSASENLTTSCLLKISTIFFAVSLASNSGIAFVLKMTDTDGKLAHFFQITSPFAYVFIAGQWSFGSGIVCLILYFNIFAGLIFIALSVFSVFAFFKTFNKFRKSEDAAHLKRMELLRKEDAQLLNELSEKEN